MRYLRWSRIRSLILCAGLVAALFAAWPACSHALEPPRPGELQRYRLDGSLGRRLQMARRLGNDKVAPRLVERLRAQLRTARLGLSVASPPVMTPPPAWRGMPTSGNVKILTLLISFKDYPGQPTAPAAVQDKLFGDGDAHAYPYESVRSYYDARPTTSSHIGGDVLGWYRTPYTRRPGAPDRRRSRGAHQGGPELLRGPGSRLQPVRQRRRRRDRLLRRGLDGARQRLVQLLVGLQDELRRLVVHARRQAPGHLLVAVGSQTRPAARSIRAS